ncbi:hypothetical protein [Pontibacillus yanchengensis]|uniref:Uncharacterized protein n=1 Tax=Pontibacillus yanchengensis Y32 TaxID=1385514 RepID=A0A0A2T8B2_9BACI|nr:hypothetical protein [Pontibacillus yanchengensis]KGP72042.1 hypothetical protein N782_14270 [Pontibacillus yanchengensis Y32]
MLTNEQIQDLKNRLYEMKTEAEKELDNHKGYESSEGGPEDSVGELSELDNHPGEVGTENFEQSKDYTLNIHAREQLEEINAALDRIENGKYGYSEKSGKPIPYERLQAMPTARYLVEEQENA